jgi:hypothetical protein
VQEELAAPHSPGLPTVESAGETRGTDGALEAEGLGCLDVGGTVGEEQLGVLPVAGQLVVDAAAWVQDADTHLSPPLEQSLWIVRNKKAADPGFRVPRPGGRPM